MAATLSMENPESKGEQYKGHEYLDGLYFLKLREHSAGAIKGYKLYFPMSLSLSTYNFDGYQLCPKEKILFNTSFFTAYICCSLNTIVKLSSSIFEGSSLCKDM